VRLLTPTGSQKTEDDTCGRGGAILPRPFFILFLSLIHPQQILETLQ